MIMNKMKEIKSILKNMWLETIWLCGIVKQGFAMLWKAIKWVCRQIMIVVWILVDILATVSLILAMWYIPGLWKVVAILYWWLHKFCRREQEYKVYMRFIYWKESPYYRAKENKYRLAIRVTRYVWVWFIIGFWVFFYSTTICVPFGAQWEDAEAETWYSFIEALNDGFRNRSNRVFWQNVIIRLLKLIVEKIMVDLKAFYDWLP